MFAVGLAAVLLKNNVTLVILIQDGVGGAITLGIKETVGPKYDRHKVVGSYELSFSGALSINFLLGGGLNRHVLSTRHADTRMPTYPCGMQAIHPPFGNRDRIRA